MSDPLPASFAYSSLYEAFRHARDRDPMAPAILHEEGALSYAELDELALEISSGLTAQGVGVGDRVLVYSPNVPEFLAIYLACSHRGAVFAPANVGFKAREMGYICENAQAALAFVHVDVLEDFEKHTAGAVHVPETLVVLGADGRGDGASGPITLGDFRKPADGAAAYPARPDDPALICFTSGTTSTPKPVLHGHGSEVYNAVTYAHVHHLGPGDRGIVAMPLAWAYGLTTSSAALLAAGGAVVLLNRFHPVRFLECIERFGVTVVYATMSMYTKMLDVLSQRSFALETVRLCINGGEACPDAAIRAVESATSWRLIQAYAASEVRPVTAVDAHDPAPPRQTAGQLVPGARLRLVDPEGKVITDPGVAGEAEMTSPGQMLGYHREPEMTETKLASDGWFRTGDLVTRDDDGYFFVVGRQSEMIIRSGANVAPAEVESALLDLDEVADAGVIGRPDPVSGEEVVALVVPARKTEFDFAEVRRKLGESLAAYKLPTSVVLVEAIPVNASGKTDRAAMRLLAASTSP